MAKQTKQYDYSELTQLDTDELLKVYNRTAERLNKQIKYFDDEIETEGENE